MSGSERSAKLSVLEGSLLVRYEREAVVQYERKAVVRRLEAEIEGEGKKNDVHFRKGYNYMTWCSEYKQVTLEGRHSQYRLHPVTKVLTLFIANNVL
jgi:hypothetical protein